MKTQSFFITFLTTLAAFIVASQAVFSQIPDTIIPPPPPPYEIPKTSWEMLDKEEKLLLSISREKIKAIDNSSDSILNSLKRYLIDRKANIYNFQVMEAVKLIYQIPNQESLLFLINNIDFFANVDDDASIHKQWKNFPFYVVLISDENSFRIHKFIDLIFTSNILNNCSINGKKLEMFKSLILKSMNYEDSIVNTYLNFQLKKAKDKCAKSNIEILISGKYLNLKYSNKIVK